MHVESLSWPSEKKKKRRSRWANDEADKTFIPGMPTTLPADATDEQKEQYLRKYSHITNCLYVLYIVVL